MHFRRKAYYKNQEQLKTIISVAQGKMPAQFVIKNAKFLDVFNGEFVLGDVAVQDSFIAGIGGEYHGEKTIDAKGQYLVPGFIDTHLHIESSLLTPDQFQQAVMPHGTTSVIWDPHEIANIKGENGIQWAIDSTKNLLLDVFIMLSSCVPALSSQLNFETKHYELDANLLTKFQHHWRVLGLGEFMNYLGVLKNDAEVMEKINAFKQLLCDGHSPLLTGHELTAYTASGIHTDHEGTTLNEAKEHLRNGQHVLIREGTCAKNADSLLPLLNEYTSSVIAFCTDDKNPLEIQKTGHIDCIINKALKLGIKPEVVFRAASYSAANIYNLKDRGAIAPGYLADFVLVQPKNHVWKNGASIQSVYKEGIEVNRETLSYHVSSALEFKGKNVQLAHFDKSLLKSASTATNKQSAHVIGLIPDQVITENLTYDLPTKDGEILADIKNDILKIAVFERHQATGNHTIGFVKGFGIKQGAIAMTICHDAHNLIVVGSSDDVIYTAIQKIIELDGGIVVCDDVGSAESLALPFAGLMSGQAPNQVADKLEALYKKAKNIGCQLNEPFLALGFLALPVIPKLKITDRGLIDVENFVKIKKC